MDRPSQGSLTKEGTLNSPGALLRQSTMSQAGVDFLHRIRSGLPGSGSLSQDNRMLSMRLDEVAGLAGTGAPDDLPPSVSADAQPEQPLPSPFQQPHQLSNPDSSEHLQRTNSSVQDLTFDDLMRFYLDTSSHQQPSNPTPQSFDPSLDAPAPAYTTGCEQQEQQDEQTQRHTHQPNAQPETFQQPMNMPPSLSGRSVEEIWREIQGGRSTQPVESETVAGFFDKLGGQYANVPQSVWPATAAAAGTVKRRNNEELKQEVKQEAWQEALQAQAAAQQENAKVTQGASGQEGHSGESDGASGNATSESGRKRKSVEQTEEERKRKQQQRMVKNRESAARSRERKQRYTAALEDKVEQLTTANQQLREELDKKEHDHVTHAEVEHSREQDGPLTRRQLRRYHSGPPNIDL